MYNLNKLNIEIDSKMIKKHILERFGMFVNELENDKDVKISKSSRKICPKSLIGQEYVSKLEPVTGFPFYCTASKFGIKSKISINLINKVPSERFC